jgi:hypothetical protein
MIFDRRDILGGLGATLALAFGTSARAEGPEADPELEAERENRQ